MDSQLTLSEFYLYLLLHIIKTVAIYRLKNHWMCGFIINQLTIKNVEVGHGGSEVNLGMSDL